MSQIETSTETVERLAKHHDLLHPKVETVTLFGKTSAETAQVLRDLASERDQWMQAFGHFLAAVPLQDVLKASSTVQDAIDYFKRVIAERDTAICQAEDSARVCAEQAEEILRLQGQLAEVHDRALNDAQRAVSLADPQQDLDPRDPAMRDNPYLQAWEAIESLKPDPAPRPGDMSSQGVPITFTYTNWRGETAQRTAVPKSLWFGVTDWHPEPGWLMTAHDLEKAADRDFALADCAFSAPRQTEQEAANVLLGAPRSITGPMAHAGRVAEAFLEDVECGGEIATELIEAFLRAIAQEGQADAS